jgi:hypothetical protein
MESSSRSPALDASHYHYSSAAGAFERELTTGAKGVVLDYPGL